VASGRVRGRIRTRGELSNKGMKLSKPEYLVGGWPTRLGIIESGFAAHAQCSTDGRRANAGKHVPNVAQAWHDTSLR
jgi:hypothetical protein